MTISKSDILEGMYYPLKAIKDIGRTFRVSSPNCLRVLIYHDIAPYDHKRFAEQMEWLSRSWNFITPQQFSAIHSGEEPVCGKQLLVTFDDGFASNRVVAEKILNPMGIQALFFVVSDFIGIQDEAEAKCFIAKNICVDISVDHPLPAHWKNMSWKDLEALLEQGHTIGAHTKSHARLSCITDPFLLKEEIVDSADIIAGKLGIDIDHFAYTFGDINSISKQALDIAKARFHFIYSGIRGDNHDNAKGIYRDTAASQDNLLNYFIYTDRLLGSFLEGAADFYYSSKRKKFQNWYQAQTKYV
jgi:peptidoglycan/xylan/chitin deacetylase (PgdA/CDA1 family)